MINLCWRDGVRAQVTGGTERMKSMMMDGHMMGGGMMVAMGLVWVLVIAVLVLGCVALVKYIRSNGAN